MSSVVIAGNTSGTVTLNAPDIAGTTVLTLPTTSGTILTTASGQWITTGSNIYYNTGNVGIGNSSPTMYWSGSNKGLSIGGTSNGAEIDLKTSGSTSTSYMLQDVAYSFNIGNSGAYPIAFYTSDTERMRINSSGVLSIGAATSYGNTVNAFGVTPALDSGGLIFAGATDSYAADKGGQVMMGGKYRALGDYASFGGMAAKKENGTDGNYAGYLQFLVSNYPSGNVERMRINSNGDVFINSTNYPVVGIEKFGVNGNTTIAGAFSTSSASNPTVWVNNSTTGTVTLVRFSSGTGGNTVGNITANGSNTTYSTSSDYRLKENVLPMTGALATVSALKPVTYTWKSTGENGQGFIAHELAEVVPDCVVGEKDATEIVDVKDEEGNVIGQETKPVYQGIDTSFLVATLTAAIQEQQAIITDLKARIEVLENK